MAFTDNYKYMGLDPLDLDLNKTEYVRYHQKELIEFFEILTEYLGYYKAIMRSCLSTVNIKILTAQKAKKKDKDLKIDLSLNSNDYIRTIGFTSFYGRTASGKEMNSINLIKFLQESEFTKEIASIQKIHSNIQTLHENQEVLNGDIQIACVEFADIQLDMNNMYYFITRCKLLALNLDNRIISTERILEMINFSKMQILYLLGRD